MRRLLVLVFVTAILLVACSSNKIDDSTTKLYISKAEKVVTLLNQEKFDELRTLFDDTMKDALTVEQLKETNDIIKESGRFVSFEKSSVVLREGYFITSLTTKYSKDQRVYSITFDDQRRMAGLYVK
ncbi:DUF3887 domain-containing protein [Sporosarcina sp. GW1-11]|uniref:DUF3887 domain-containing protein n=1 Tax=Sporosarcina sp. GW1-11 TaxID=2899126 RepID=UPI00294DD540|nr:DUF3887 domain-containing protein [Sporosarcina sp. GW1-11]MDV6377468.1 DUF3887 domain-containing protein [Sporosarcina sp. GW1-11]